MAGSKEIRTKIKSVQNTRKITKAIKVESDRPGAQAPRKIQGEPFKEIKP